MAQLAPPTICKQHEKAGNDMRSKSTRLFTATMAAAMLMAALSACGLIGGNGNGGGLGDIVVVDDGGSSAPGSTSPSGSSNGGGDDEDNDAAGFSENDDNSAADLDDDEVTQADPFDNSTPGISYPTGPAIGSIDSEIVGQWGCTIGSTPTRYTYQFNADGTFLMVRAASTVTTATYYTSNGVVYLQNVVTTYRDESTPLADKESEYSFDTDQYGEYMLIAAFSTSESIPDSNPVYKFRK